MASLELADQETISKGIINNNNITPNDKKENKFTLTSRDDFENGNKKFRKSKVVKFENVPDKENYKTHLEKENNNTSEKLENKRKSNRLKQKDTRKPLEALNANKEIPKKDETKILSQNLFEKENSSPLSSEKEIQKQNLPFENIVVNENIPSLSTKEEDLGQENHLYESCGNLQPKNNPQGRLSPRENKRNSPTFAVSSRIGKCRYTLNDLSSIKSVNDKKIELLFPFKNGCFDKKLSTRQKPLRKSSPNPGELENVFTELEATFPNIDPDFLKSQCIKLKGSLRDTIDVVVIKEKTGTLPTRADYLKRMEIEKLQTKYKNNFSIESFLKILPNPWEYFLNMDTQNRIKYANHSFYYLKNSFKKHYLQTIQEVFLRNEFSLYLSSKELQKKNRTLKMRATNRSKMECYAGKPTTFNIDFMHEVAFIENENKIKAHLRKTEMAKSKRFKQAEKEGALLNCQSCQLTGFLQEDTINCLTNHVFCKDCMVRYVSAEVEKENIHFKCLVKCEEKFSLANLQDFLSPIDIVSVIHRIQSEETKSPTVDRLISCPFCYHLSILPVGFMILRCPNPMCMLEFCRLCKQLNHSPLKCNEEGSDLNKAEMENSMNNPSPLCIICKERFVEEDGLNQMACSCGATLCFNCRPSFPDCPHFNTKFVVKELPSSNSSDESEFLEATECEQEHIDNNDCEANSNSTFFDPTEAFLDIAPTDSNFF